MSVDIQGKSLEALRQENRALLAEIDKDDERYTKGEMTPVEIEEYESKLEDAEALDAAIKSFPTVQNARERKKAIFASARQPATPPPPTFGVSVKGAGGTGSPESRHEEQAAALKSFGELIVEELARDKGAGAGWKSGVGNQAWGRELKHLMRIDGVGFDNDAEESAVKATLTTTGLTSYDRRPGVLEVATQRLTVADLLAQGATDSPTIRYLAETSYTNAATSVSEGGDKPEATLAFEERDAAVRKVAVWTKISEETMEDFAQLRSFVDGRLRFMVSEREEALLLNGDGSPPNIRGILQTSGIQTQARSTDTHGDAVMKAITKVRATGKAEPDAIVVHPTDYQTMRLDADANGQYYGGGSFYSPYAGAGMVNNGVIPIWGLRTVVTTAIGQGTALVGRFMDAQLFRRSGVVVQFTNTDQDDFIKNLVTVRAESRLALAVYRPLSFVSVTGL